MRRRSVLLGAAATAIASPALAMSSAVRQVLLGGGLTGGQRATLTRLKAAAASALNNNPVDLVDMASPPTITQSASHDATLSVQASYLSSPSSFRVSSGNKYARTTTGGLYVGTANLSPATDGNLSFVTSLSPSLVNGGENEICYTASIATLAQVVELSLRVPGATQPYRIIVNNQFVARDGLANTSQFCKLDFGSSALRTITVEAQTAEALLNVAVGVGNTITAPTDPVIVGAVTGDSITESTSSGETTFYAYDGWGSSFAKQAGINSLRNAAVGGTGYINVGSTRSKIYDQMNYWISGDTYDVIAFAGGYNDTGSSAGTITTEALACWRRARAAQPNALILVLGVWGEATGPSASVLSVEATLLAAFNAWGDKFSRFIPISNDPAGAWITGTDYVGHIVTGLGNSGTVVSSDGTHPSRPGRIYGGGKVNTAYRALLATLH